MQTLRMTSTFSHHFDAVALSKFHLNNTNIKHKRSSSFQASSSLSNNNSNNNKDNNDNKNNLKLLKPIIEIKSTSKKSRRDSRSHSFQISRFNHNKVRRRANRKLLNNKQPITVSPNINMIKIKFDGTSVGTKYGSKPARKIPIGLVSKKSMKLSSTQQFDSNSFDTKDLSINIKGNRLNKNKNKNVSKMTPKESPNITYEYPMDIMSIINNCIEAKWTLPFVVDNFDNHHILKVLYHPKIRANPGWFHRFLNSQNIDLNTALHITAINGELDIAQILLTNFSVLKNVLNHDHKTPLDLALETNNYDLSQLLLKNNAIPGPSYYNLNSKYESKLSYQLRTLLNKYLNISTNRYNIAEAMRLYEKPLAFRHQFYSESSLDLLSCFGSDVASTPTSSRIDGQSNRFDSSQPTAFFNSFVDF